MQEPYLQDLRFGSLQLHMVGLAALGPEQLAATGSAAELGSPPLERAYFELLERISIYEARGGSAALWVRDRQGRALERRPTARVFPLDPRPERRRLSLSNGVALHQTWEQACSAALDELIERDRILRSFAGEFAAVRLDYDPSELAQAAAEHYDASAFQLGDEPEANGARHTSVFCLTPRNEQLPLILGFGTAHDLRAAVAKAEREAAQRLAFLWGEPLPEGPVVPSPTPEYHHDYYLCPANHGHLRAWLEGRLTTRPAWRKLPRFQGEGTRFIELTPAALRGKLAVAKAISPRARRLRFGLPAHPKDAVPHPLA
jgi:hypothetical protein